MRYLLAVWDGGGATPPNLGVARRLIARGHEVVVYGDPTLAAAITATGASHRPWPTAPQRRSEALEHDVLRDWECRTPIGAFHRLRDRLVSGPSARFASDVADALDAEPFDALLVDGVLMGALVAGEARGIPTAALVGSVYLAPSPTRTPFGLGLAPARGRLGRARDRFWFRVSNGMWDPGLRELNPTRAAHGLDPLPHLWSQWEHADRVLVLTAAAFDDPAPLPANARHVGPVLEDLPSGGGVALPPGDDPLVVVGLSSSYMEQAPLLRRIAAALAALPVRAVITTGPAIDPGEVPGASNLRIVRSAAHTELLPSADLVITHAGHGTLIKSLAFGVPVLCLPIGRDQPDNAARAKRLGVAEVRSPRSRPEAIGAAVSRMLADPGYRDAAEALGRRIRAEVDAGSLVAELEALAGAPAVRAQGGESARGYDRRPWHSPSESSASPTSASRPSSTP